MSRTERPSCVVLAADSSSVYDEDNMIDAVEKISNAMSCVSCSSQHSLVLKGWLQFTSFSVTYFLLCNIYKYTNQPNSFYRLYRLCFENKAVLCVTHYQLLGTYSLLLIAYFFVLFSLLFIVYYL